VRPILMTSFAFIVGLLPLTWATGGSALGDRSIGTGSCRRHVTGVMLGIFIIPVLFVIFQYLQESSQEKSETQNIAIAGIKFLEMRITPNIMFISKQYSILFAVIVSFLPAKWARNTSARKFNYRSNSIQQAFPIPAASLTLNGRNFY